MRVAFAGSPAPAVGPLRALAASHHEVGLVITQPDKARGRSRRPSPTPVAQAAEELGIPVIRPPTINDPEVDRALAEAGVELLAVVAFGQILRDGVLSRWPCVNVHFSLLPAYRGAAPVERAIMDGVTETGVTIMRMEAGLDTGPVYAARAVPVGGEDDGGPLTARLSRPAGPLLVEALDEIAAGRAGADARSPRRASPWRPRSAGRPRARLLPPRRRAGAPRARPLAAHRRHLPHRRRDLQDLGRPGPRRGRAGGSLGRDGRLVAGCGGGSLEILELQPPGRARMDAGAFLRGWRGALDHGRVGAGPGRPRVARGPQRRAARAAAGGRGRLRRPRAGRGGPARRARPALPRPGHAARLRGGPAAADPRLAHRRRPRPPGRAGAGRARHPAPGGLRDRLLRRGSGPCRGRSGGPPGARAAGIHGPGVGAGGGRERRPSPHRRRGAGAPGGARRRGRRGRRAEVLDARLDRRAPGGVAGRRRTPCGRWGRRASRPSRRCAGTRCAGPAWASSPNCPPGLAPRRPGARGVRPPAPFALEDSRAWARGLAMGQSRASLLAARVVDPAAGRAVLDLCAAPGAKATHIAALSRGGARITAVELRPARARRCASWRTRMGAASRSSRATRREACARGRLRRRAGRSAVHRPRRAVGAARRPLAPARGGARPAGGAAARPARPRAGAARPGGRVVYSTCTLIAEENEDVVRRGGGRVEDLAASYPGLAHPRAAGGAPHPPAPRPHGRLLRRARLRARGGRVSPALPERPFVLPSLMSADLLQRGRAARRPHRRRGAGAPRGRHGRPLRAQPRPGVRLRARRGGADPRGRGPGGRAPDGGAPGRGGRRCSPRPATRSRPRGGRPAPPPAAGAIREAGCRAGLGVNPGTPVEHVAELGDDLDYVNVLSIDPGFAGQTFIAAPAAGWSAAGALPDRVAIEIDGGIGRDTLRWCATRARAMFVSASTIFGAADPVRPRTASSPAWRRRELAHRLAERAALARARDLAEGGRGRVSPNPLVGRGGAREGERMVGEGWHEGPGLPHAEAMALAAAGDAARGATVVCTLEPCSHQGRTPPCADALVAAGVARVVIGCADPLERDRAQGREVLRAAGIEVVVANGADAAACAEQNAAFLTWAVTGLPHVTLKLATSLDGKIATAAGESRWISGPASRAPGAPLAGRPRRRGRGDGDRAGRRPAPHGPRRGGARAPARARRLRLVGPPAARLGPGPRRPGAAVIVLAADDAPPERVAALATPASRSSRCRAAPPSGSAPACARWGRGASSRSSWRAAPSSPARWSRRGGGPGGVVPRADAHRRRATRRRPSAGTGRPPWAPRRAWGRSTASGWATICWSPAASARWPASERRVHGTRRGGRRRRRGGPGAREGARLVTRPPPCPRAWRWATRWPSTGPASRRWRSTGRASRRTASPRPSPHRASGRSAPATA